MVMPAACHWYHLDEMTPNFVKLYHAPLRLDLVKKSVHIELWLLHQSQPHLPDTQGGGTSGTRAILG